MHRVHWSLHTAALINDCYPCTTIFALGSLAFDYTKGYLGTGGGVGVKGGNWSTKFINGVYSCTTAFTPAQQRFLVNRIIVWVGVRYRIAAGVSVRVGVAVSVRATVAVFSIFF